MRVWRNTHTPPFANVAVACGNAHQGAHTHTAHTHTPCVAHTHETRTTPKRTEHNCVRRRPHTRVVCRVCDSFARRHASSMPLTHITLDHTPYSGMAITHTHTHTHTHQRATHTHTHSARRSNHMVGACNQSHLPAAMVCVLLCVCVCVFVVCVCVCVCVVCCVWCVCVRVCVCVLCLLR